MSSQKGTKSAMTGKPTAGGKGVTTSVANTSKVSPADMPVLPDMPSFFLDPVALDAEDMYLHILRNTLFQHEYERSTVALHDQLRGQQEKNESLLRYTTPFMWDLIETVERGTSFPCDTQATGGVEVPNTSLTSRKPDYGPSSWSSQRGQQHPPTTEIDPHIPSGMALPTSMLSGDNSIISPLGSPHGAPLYSESEAHRSVCRLEASPVPVVFSGPPPPVIATLADTIGLAMATCETRARALSLTTTRQTGAAKEGRLSNTAPPFDGADVTFPSVDQVSEVTPQETGKISKSSVVPEIPILTATSPPLPRYVSAFPLADALVLEAEQRVAVELFCADICTDIVEAAAAMYVSRFFDAASIAYTAFSVWDEIRDSVLRSFVPIDSGEPYRAPSGLTIHLSDRIRPKKSEKVTLIEEGQESSEDTKHITMKEKNYNLGEQGCFGLLPTWSFTPSLLHAEDILAFHDTQAKPVSLQDLSHHAYPDEGYSDQHGPSSITENIVYKDAPPEVKKHTKLFSEESYGKEVSSPTTRIPLYRDVPDDPSPASGNDRNAETNVPADNTTLSYLLDSPPLRVVPVRFAPPPFDTDGDTPGAPPAPIPFDNHARYVVARYSPSPPLEKKVLSPDEAELINRLLEKQRRAKKLGSAASRRTEGFSIWSVGGQSKNDSTTRSHAEAQPVNRNVVKIDELVSDGVSRQSNKRVRLTTIAKSLPPVPKLDSHRMTLTPVIQPPRDDQWTRAMQRLPGGYFTVQTTPLSSRQRDRVDSQNRPDRTQPPPQPPHHQPQPKIHPPLDSLVVIDGEEITAVANTPLAPSNTKKANRDSLQLTGNSRMLSGSGTGKSRKSAQEQPQSRLSQRATSALFEPVCIDDQLARVQVNVMNGGTTTFSAVRAEDIPEEIPFDDSPKQDQTPPQPPQPSRRSQITFSLLSRKQQKALEDRQRRQKEAAERTMYENKFILVPTPPPPPAGDETEPDVPSSAHIRPEPGVVMERWVDAPETTGGGGGRQDTVGKHSRTSEKRRARSRPVPDQRLLANSGRDDAAIVDGGEWAPPPGRYRWAEFEKSTQAAAGIRAADRPNNENANVNRNANESGNASQAKSTQAKSPTTHLASSATQRTGTAPMQSAASSSRPAGLAPDAPRSGKKQVRVVAPPTDLTKHAHANKGGGFVKDKKSPQISVIVASSSAGAEAHSLPNTNAQRAFGLPWTAKNIHCLPRIPEPQRHMKHGGRRGSGTGRNELDASADVGGPGEAQSALERRNKVLDLVNVLQKIQK